MDFNIAASGWDTERRVKRAEIIADEIAKSIHTEPHSKAMELGCGTGLISFRLGDRFEHITLVDSSEGMINELDKKIRDAGITNMTAVCADITQKAGPSVNIPQTAGFSACEPRSDLGSERFDVIYTSMALHHITDVGAALKILHGLLGNDGTICIVDLTPDDGSFHRLEKDFNGHNGFEEEELKAVLEDAGFADIRSQVFYEDTKRVEDRDVPYSLFIMTGSKTARG